MTAKISKIKGLRIYEVPISYFGRTYEEGKKIGWKDGVSAIRCIIKYNLLTKFEESFTASAKSLLAACKVIDQSRLNSITRIPSPGDLPVKTVTEVSFADSPGLR
jgi:hypothetical protein